MVWADENNKLDFDAGLEDLVKDSKVILSRDIRHGILKLTAELPMPSCEVDARSKRRSGITSDAYSVRSAGSGVQIRESDWLSSSAIVSFRLQLALLQPLQFEFVVARIDHQPRDHGIEIAMLGLERSQTAHGGHGIFRIHRSACLIG